MALPSDKVLEVGGNQLFWLVEAARQARRRFASHGPNTTYDDLRAELVSLVTMGEGDDVTAEFTDYGFRFSDSAIRFLLDAVEQEIAWISPLVASTGGRNWESWHTWLLITRDQLRIPAIVNTHSGDRDQSEATLPGWFLWCSSLAGY